MKRWIALDVGTKTIGVAVSDPLKWTARPLLTITRKTLAEDTARIAELVQEQDVERIIVGRALFLSGEGSPIQTVIEAFHSALQKACADIRIDWADERLSSKEAEEIMSALGVPVRERRARRDEFAAAVILTRFLQETPDVN